MRKNTTAVYKAWKNGSRKTFHSIKTDGQTIFSYSTPILQRDVGELPRLNMRYYSVTAATGSTL